MVFVQLMQLPHSIKGFVRDNGDGTYTIVLNSRLSYEQNLITYKHELSHILNGDFDKRDFCDVGTIERSAHDGQENERYDKWKRVLPDEESYW